MIELHKKYGKVVRVAPYIVNFKDASFWKDVMKHRKAGEVTHEKEPLHYTDTQGALVGQTGQTHARQRRVLAHAFSAMAMADQQPLMKVHFDDLIKGLKERCEDGKAMIPIDSWYVCKLYPRFCATVAHVI